MRKVLWAAIFVAAAGLAGALLLPGLAPQSQFPAKPIEITVPFGPGNAADVTARHLAEGMSKKLGVPVPVMNRPGGGGAVAFTYTSQQKPDGYALGYITNSISTNYYSGILPFDHTALAPVARVTIETPVLVVKATRHGAPSARWSRRPRRTQASFA